MPNVTHTKKVIYTGAATGGGANYTWINVDSVSWVTAPTLMQGTTDTWEFDVSPNTGSARQSEWRVEHWDVAQDATLVDSFTIYQEGVVLVPAYDTLTNDSGGINVNEGTTITYTVQGTDLTDGTVPYAITGVNNADVDVALSGTITITGNTGTFAVQILEDNNTEPAPENIIFSLGATDSNGVSTGSLSNSVGITDSSQDAPFENCYSFELLSGDAKFGANSGLVGNVGTETQAWAMTNQDHDASIYITASPGDVFTIEIEINADSGYDLANNTPITLGTGAGVITSQTFDTGVNPDTGTFIIEITQGSSESNICIMNQINVATASEFAPFQQYNISLVIPSGEEVGVNQVTFDAQNSGTATYIGDSANAGGWLTQWNANASTSVRLIWLMETNAGFEFYQFTPFTVSGNAQATIHSQVVHNPTSCTLTIDYMTNGTLTDNYSIAAQTQAVPTTTQAPTTQAPGYQFTFTGVQPSGTIQGYDTPVATFTWVQENTTIPGPALSNSNFSMSNPTGGTSYIQSMTMAPNGGPAHTGEALGYINPTSGNNSGTSQPVTFDFVPPQGTYISGVQVNSIAFNWVPCIVYGQPILMADGTTKLVEDIVVGDEVKALSISGLGLGEDDYKTWTTSNFSSSDATTIITGASHGNYEKYHLLSFSEGSDLKITHEHPVLSNRAGEYAFRRVDELLVNDEVLNAESGWVTLNSNTVISETAQTVALAAETADNYFAQGVLVHNDITQK